MEAIRSRRYTIALATLSKVDVAREEARGILREAERGIDPAEAEAPPQGDTVRMLVAQFIDDMQSRKPLLANDPPAFGAAYRLSVGEAKDRLHYPPRRARPVGRSGCDGLPVAANRALAAGRKMFDWAVEETCPAYPFAGVKPRGTETERERVLSDTELTWVLHAADKEGGMVCAFIKTLILTRNDETKWRGCAGKTWISIER